MIKVVNLATPSYCYLHMLLINSGSCRGHSISMSPEEWLSCLTLERTGVGLINLAFWLKHQFQAPIQLRRTLGAAVRVRAVELGSRPGGRRRGVRLIDQAGGAGPTYVSDG